MLHLSELKPSEIKGGAVVAIGNFDGVHLGHAEIVRTVKERSALKNEEPILLTFDPHPMEVLRGVQIKKLITLERKIELFHQLGISRCICLIFDRELAKMGAEAFLLELMQRLNMRTLVLGETSHLGNNREGTPQMLKQVLAKYNVETLVVPTHKVDGKFISSSHIREQLQLGNVEEVNACLGRLFETEGVVIKGKSLGEKLGYPTLNIANPVTMSPARGVYATKTMLHGKTYESITNVGVRPTFYENSSEVIETHLIDVQLHSQPEKITIEWVGRLREEKKFKDSGELQEQIKQDIDSAKKKLR